MKAIVAPDSWKGCLSSAQAAAAMHKGLLKAGFDEVEEILMADGGEGTAEAVLKARGGIRVPVRVTGAMGAPVQAEYIRFGETAFIEMASAAGLTLVEPQRRNPLVASTYGVGQLIRHALEQGSRIIYVGMGGSATNDGGTGMAAALGVRFLDQSGNELPAGGAALLGLCEIEMDALMPQAREATFIAVSDVDNPLCGPRGASTVFGPQKGATPTMVSLLDEALARLGRVIAHDVGRDVAQLPGAGAAGGLGAGMMAFCNAKLLPGADFLLDMAGMDEKLKGADLVLTGEGKTDGQTLSGKAPLGVARRAQRAGIPSVCLSGALDEGWQALMEQGFTAVMSVCDRPMTLEEALTGAGERLEEAAFAAGRIFLAGRRI